MQSCLWYYAHILLFHVFAIVNTVCSGTLLLLTGVAVTLKIPLARPEHASFLSLCYCVQMRPQALRSSQQCAAVWDAGAALHAGQCGLVALTVEMLSVFS